MAHTCAKCPATWTGLKIAHCSACHHTFSTVSHFDKHRFRGACLSPEAMKTVRKVKTPGGQVQEVSEPVFKLNAKGVWVGARERGFGG